MLCVFQLLLRCAAGVSMACWTIHEVQPGAHERHSVSDDQRGFDQEHRWKWLLLGLILIVPLGIGCFIPGNYIEVSWPMMLFLEVICFTSGVITLVSFIRHHQPPAPAAE